MSEMPENYKFTSESDSSLTTPPVRCPPKLMLGLGEVGGEKFGNEERGAYKCNLNFMCL